MQQIVDFILELDKLKGVTRKTRPLGLERYRIPLSTAGRLRSLRHP